MIINHNSQVVGEQPITAMNDKIFPCQFFVGVNNAAQLVSKLRDRMLLADTHCGIVWSMMQHPAMTVVNTANALNTRTRNRCSNNLVLVHVTRRVLHDRRGDVAIAREHRRPSADRNVPAGAG
ncbi:Uncharacterised protein [Escherichia coli]|nr:Uncharacterised protein [Escherichia coli]